MNISLSECPEPFQEERNYPRTGGYIPGRYCGASPINKDVICCLPCPIQQWVFPDNYITELRIVDWIGLASLCLCIFLLLSYAVLPPEKSHRHYLTVGLVMAITLVQISFVIPLATDPELCTNDITPRDQYDSLSCAWSGALVLAGAIGIAVWATLRSLWLHLSIVWDVEPGKVFTYSAISAGVFVPAAIVTACLSVTGVSFRMGQVCFPNQRHTYTTWWGWLLTFAGLAFLLQVGTVVYALFVYVRFVKRQKRGGKGSGGYTGRSSADFKELDGDRAASALRQATWRKVRQLFLMQWRGIAITMWIIIQTAYFVATFWGQDVKFGNFESNAQDIAAARKWSICLILNGGDKRQCLKLAEGLMISREQVLGSLAFAALTGLTAFLLLARPSMFSAWYDLLVTPIQRYIARRRTRNFLTSLDNEPGFGAFGFDNEFHPRPTTDADKDAFLATTTLNKGWQITASSHATSRDATPLPESPNLVPVSNKEGTTTPVPASRVMSTGSLDLKKGKHRQSATSGAPLFTLEKREGEKGRLAPIIIDHDMGWDPEFQSKEGTVDANAAPASKAAAGQRKPSKDGSTQMTMQQIQEHRTEKQLPPAPLGSHPPSQVCEPPPDFLDAAEGAPPHHTLPSSQTPGTADRKDKDDPVIHAPRRVSEDSMIILPAPRDPTTPSTVPTQTPADSKTTSTQPHPQTHLIDLSSLSGFLTLPPSPPPPPKPQTPTAKLPHPPSLMIPPPKPTPADHVRSASQSGDDGPLWLRKEEEGRTVPEWDFGFGSKRASGATQGPGPEDRRGSVASFGAGSGSRRESGGIGKAV